MIYVYFPLPEGVKETPTARPVALTIEYLESINSLDINPTKFLIPENTLFKAPTHSQTIGISPLCKVTLTYENIYYAPAVTYADSVTWERYFTDPPRYLPIKVNFYDEDDKPASVIVRKHSAEKLIQAYKDLSPEDIDYVKNLYGKFDVVYDRKENITNYFESPKFLRNLDYKISPKVAIENLQSARDFLEFMESIENDTYPRKFYVPPRNALYDIFKSVIK